MSNFSLNRDQDVTHKEYCCTSDVVCSEIVKVSFDRNGYCMECGVSSSEEEHVLTPAEYSIHEELKLCLQRIQSGDCSLGSSGHYLNGTFQRLMAPSSFADLVYPGAPTSVRSRLPKSLEELLQWESVYSQIQDLLPRINKSAYDVLEGVKAKGKARGDIMDAMTESILLPQIAQEALAREIVSIVENLSKRASKLRSKLKSDIASPTDDRASRDLIDESALQAILPSSRALPLAVQDELLGDEWIQLALSDLVRFISEQKSKEGESPDNPRIFWIDERELDSYPALLEIVQALQSLTFEVNAKTNCALNLLEPSPGTTLLSYYPTGSKQAPRVDSRQGLNDAGFRLTFNYHILVASLREGEEPSSCSKIKFSDKTTSEVLDILNDRLTIHRSLDVISERIPSCQPYYVITFFAHGN